MNIKLIDTFCTGIVHVQFNASLLAMLSLQYKNFFYYASVSNKENVYRLGDNVYKFSDCVEYKPIFVLNGSSRLALLLRHFISLFQNIRFLLTSSKNDLLIFNYNNTFALKPINVLNKYLNRKVLIFCHGELETLLPNNISGGIFYKLIRRSVRAFFYKKKKSNLHFCVLGESVLHNIKNTIPSEISNNFHYIDHPYIYVRKYNKPAESDSTINIGWVGEFNAMKGGEEFLRLAYKLKGKNIHKVQLSITGRINYKMDELENIDVNLPIDKGQKFVTISEYYQRISKLRYIIFLYPVNSYKLIASGAIMDAIDFELPIIGLKNQYFEYMFSKFGEFGYLFDNVEEMYGFINSNEFLKCPTNDFERIKKETSPELILPQLQTIINSIAN